MRSLACVIGIDVGTSGVRTVAMNQEHKLLDAGARCLFSELQGDPRSPAVWWQGIVKTLQDTLAQLGNTEVVALSVDGTSGSLLPVDIDGQPLANPMMYNDAVRDPSILDIIARLLPKNSAAGGATSGLAKALMFSSLKPAHIIHQADWIVGKLTGNFAMSDANNALKTGYDAVAGHWPEWLTETGLNRALLPAVFAPGTPLSVLSSGIAKQFGLSENVLVVAGTTDGCASFLATGANSPGDAVTALGSTMTLKLLSDRPIYAPEFGVYSHSLGDQWLAGGASNSGGKVLEGFFNATQLASLSTDMDTHTPSGLDYYPLPKTGERFPINDPALEPRMQPRPSSDVKFLQGLLEGMSTIEALGYRRLVDNGAPPLRSLRTVGGGAANGAWTAIRQQQLGVEFKPTESSEAAAGTARLAHKGATAAKLW